MRIHHVLPLVVLAGSGIAVWACGSDDGAATNANADGGPDGATSSSSGSSGSTSSSSGSTGEGGTSSSSSGGAPGGDGGTNPPDAGPGGDLTSLTCGATACALPAEQCCVSEVPGPGNSRNYGCITAAGDAGCPPLPNGDDVTALKCSSQANCPANTVCCVRETGSGNAASECKPSCGNNEAQLCDPKAASTGCPQQDPCDNDNIDDWGLPRTYATCGGQGN